MRKAFAEGKRDVPAQAGSADAFVDQIQFISGEVKVPSNTKSTI
jgi:hypothetical protein